MKHLAHSIPDDHDAFQNGEITKSVANAICFRIWLTRQSITAAGLAFV